MISLKNRDKSSEDLTNVYVYPNPVRPQYDGTVKIAGLINRANVKITDIAGNLVLKLFQRVAWNGILLLW
jgi:hypothetical protein